MAKRVDQGAGGAAPYVLVVDDDPDIRHSIKMLLSDAGYPIREAADGLAALEKIHAHPDPMVVLLDLMMPKLDGGGVLGTIVGDRHLNARLRIIIMTAGHRTQPLAFAGLVSAMRITVIEKPFELDELLDAVAKAASELPPA